MLRTFCLSAILIFIAGCSSCTKLQHPLNQISNKNYDFYDLRSASYMDRSTLIQKMKPYKVVFIGDHHDQKDLHNKVAALIKDLALQKKKVRFAAEWFTPQDNKLLARYINQTIDEKRFLKDIHWSKQVGYPFESFKPIYKALQNFQGSLVGINLSKSERQKISKQDLKAMSEDEKFFFERLDLDVSPHLQLVKPYFDHCHTMSKSGEGCEKRMYRVQVAWDSKMALEALNYLRTLNDDEVLIVFAGAMHLVKGLGINLRFSRLSHEPFITILPLPNLSRRVDYGEADVMMLYESQQAPKP